MSKAYHLNQSVVTNFTIEFFGTNGSTNVMGTPAMIVTKIVTSCGKSQWDLIHMN